MPKEPQEVACLACGRESYDGRQVAVDPQNPTKAMRPKVKPTPTPNPPKKVKK